MARQTFPFGGFLDLVFAPPLCRSRPLGCPPELAFPASFLFFQTSPFFHVLF